MFNSVENYIFLIIIAAITFFAMAIMSVNFHGASAFMHSTESIQTVDKFGFFLKSY